MDIEPAHTAQAQQHGGSGPQPCDDDDSWRELPPLAVNSAERRMQVRAYNCWTGLLGTRQFPAIAGLTPEKLARFGPCAVLLDFTQDRQNPVVSCIGTALAEECGHPGTIRHLSDVPAGSLLSRITGDYAQVLTRRAPTGFEAEFVNWRGAAILYRGILLPFSSDDDTIDHVLGVISWKELVDAHVADELQLQIGRSLSRRPAPDRSRRPVVDWADGPVARTLRGPELAGELAIEPASRDAPAGEGLLEEVLADRLRQLAPRTLASAAADGDEFALLLARRLPGGEFALLGDVGTDAQLLELAARRLLG